MFRSTPDIEPALVAVDPADLIPLSHLELDLPTPVEGWHLHLADRNIEIVEDDLGRASISRGDAKRLFAERRRAQFRSREVLARQEREAIEADQLRRASIWKGLPADRLPVGARASEAMLAAARDAQPRRQSVLQHALSNEGALEFHPYAEMDES
jgi:hypothetical protein